MEKVRVMIVEDQLIIAQDIAAKLKRNNIDVAAIYDTGEEALASVDAVAPDLVLMDVELAGAMDGISTAKMIIEKCAVPIVYLTDFVDDPTVTRAMRTYPHGYLGKPFNEAELIRTILLVLNNFKRQGNTSPGVSVDHIFLKDEKTALIKIPYSELIYLEADRAYCKVVCEEKIYMQTMSMNHVFDQINHKDFVQVHRSYVINMSKVTGLDGNMIRLGKHSVEMSRSHRPDVVARLNILK